MQGDTETPKYLFFSALPHYNLALPHQRGVKTMSNNGGTQYKALSVLRLRPRVPTEVIRPRQMIKLPDGPLVPHPELIYEDFFSHNQPPEHDPDVAMKGYRSVWKDNEADIMGEWKVVGLTPADIDIKAVIEFRPFPGMQELRGRPDDEIAEAIERHFVGAELLVLLPSPFSLFFGSDCKAITGNMQLTLAQVYRS